MSDNKLNFFSLAIDVKLHIFSFLEAEDLAKANIVCKEFNKLAENDNIWRKLFEREKKLWKAFQHEAPQTSSSNLKSSQSSIFSQFAKSVLEFLTRSEQKEKRQAKKEHSEEEEVAPNVHWKQLYLQQYLANKPKFPTEQTPRKRKIYCKIIMIGEGTEGRGAAKKLLYEIMWNPSSPVKMTGLYPGTEGLGSGVGFNVNGLDLNLVAINKYEDRKLLEQNRPAVLEYFKSADGFVYVLDSLDDLQKAKQELNNFINDGWIGKGSPLLVWLVTGPSLLTKPPTATTSVPSTSAPTTASSESSNSNTQELPERIPAEIAQEMGFNTMKDRDWSFRTVDTQTLEGVKEGLSWLSKYILQNKNT